MLGLPIFIVLKIQRSRRREKEEMKVSPYLVGKVFFFQLSDRAALALKERTVFSSPKPDIN